MNIKYKPMITITADELERIITDKYPNATIDIGSDLFYDDYINDCYKVLYILENDYDEDWNDELKTYFDYLFKTLSEAFPGQARILVDLSW
jgi:hypothetical protein